VGGSSRRRHEHGIEVRILSGTLAGSYHPTGEGKFFFTMMAAFAELERHMIHQRTMAGLQAARAKGRLGGRPTVMDATATSPRNRLEHVSRLKSRYHAVEFETNHGRLYSAAFR